MSDSMANLRRKIRSAGDLQSVVRTMKALAASSIGQYERSMRSLTDYNRAVELGLSVCLKETATAAAESADQTERAGGAALGAVVFGSDQGLVGQFNDVVAEYAVKTLAGLPGQPHVWAVGERVQARLSDAGLPLAGLFDVPSSVRAITPLVGRIQIGSEARGALSENASLYVFHNRPRVGSLYEPVSQRLLPLDAQWQQRLAEIRWPAQALPEVLCDRTATLRALIREYLFISLFRACAESLASEMACRLAAMERADRNIDDVLESLQTTFHRLRQSGIDEELFDVIAGSDALAGPRRQSVRT